MAASGVVNPASASGTVVPPRPRWSVSRAKAEEAILGVASVLAGIAAWEWLARSVSPLLVPTPSRVARAFVDLAASGELQRHLTVSGQEFATGLLLALAVGIPVSLVAGWSDRLGWMLEPLVTALNATPTIALFPLIVMWVGIGFWDKILVTFLSAFLQLFVTITPGVRATDRNWVRLAKSFGASEGRLLRSIVLPSAVPYITLGVRLAVGRAIVNVVAAELLASQAGVGFMISYYGSTFRMAEVFLAIIAVVTLGVVLTRLVAVAEGHVERWKVGLRGR